METETIIKNLSDSFGVSSFENNAFPLIKRYVNNISSDLKIEKIGTGNLIVRYGEGISKVAFFLM